MKKVIYGREYDTETAELIAEHEFGDPENFDYTFEALYRTPSKNYFIEHEFGDPENFDYTFEALYRTPSKNYFIFGEGGPLSYYAKRIGPAEKTSGWDIIPMTRAEALEWCEIYDVDANVIEKEFGDLIRKA